MNISLQLKYIKSSIKARSGNGILGTIDFPGAHPPTDASRQWHYPMCMKHSHWGRGIVVKHNLLHPLHSEMVCNSWWFFLLKQFFDVFFTWFSRFLLIRHKLADLYDTCIDIDSLRIRYTSTPSSFFTNQIVVRHWFNKSRTLRQFN